MSYPIPRPGFSESIRWSESTAYSFGIGRLKSLELLFFDRNVYNKLVATKDVSDFLRELAETRYQKFFDQETRMNPALVFSRAEIEALELCLEYANEEWFQVLLSLPVYLLNLKVGLKRQLASTSSRAGEGAMMAKLVVVKLPEDIENKVSGIAVQALTRAQEKNDPSVIDLSLDRAEVELALGISIGQDFAHRYYQLVADLLNLRMLLRLKLLGERMEELDWALIKGGNIPGELLVSLASGNQDEWRAVFSGTAFWDLIQAGFSSIGSKTGFAGVERRSRAMLISFVNRARYIALGYEPVFRFYLLWENELTNLRLIYGAKVAGLEPAVCQELVVDGNA